MTTDAGAVPLKLVPLDEDTPDELYCHYQGQFDSQPCMIVLDLRDGTFTAEYNAEIGGSVSALVYHGIIRTYSIPEFTTAKANKVLRELAEDAQKLLNGGSIEWDGHNNVGMLTAEAQEAEDRISSHLEQLCEYTESFDLVGEMDAADYWSNGELPEGLTDTTTDAELEAMVEAAETEVRGCDPFGYTILVDAEEYLTDRREEMREEQRERLEKVAEELADLRNRRNVEARRQELTAERNALIVTISGYGDSTRKVGALADVSHVHVQNILAATS